MIYCTKINTSVTFLTGIKNESLAHPQLPFVPKKSVPQRSIDWLTFEIATLIDFFFQWSHFSGKEEPTTKHKVSHCALSYFTTQIDVKPQQDKKASNNYIKMQSCHWKKFHILDWLNWKYANMISEWVTLNLKYTSKKIGSKLFASKNQIRFSVYVGGWRERRGFSVAGNCSPDSPLPWLAVLYSINTGQMSTKIKLQDKNPKNRIFASLYFYQNILKK